MDTKSSWILGWISIALSLVPWIIGVMRLIPWLSWADLSIDAVASFLAAGALLSLIAAVRGSGRWAFVALFDLIVFATSILLLNIQELHAP